mgnify:CR=1 FL=1
MRNIFPMCLFLFACSSDKDASQEDTFDLEQSNIVAFTVYTDAECTQLPPQNSVVYLDTTTSCNETPDSSISSLVCTEDRITYINHPNTSDCTADGIENELMVGVCQEFPGPVPTWKYIDPDTYNCLAP